ncbi:MAG: acyl-CoA thioesterase [Pirellulales bacterium]|nr:acyl-CoA thioesterase [Pirellulales bacterium]
MSDREPAPTIFRTQRMVQWHDTDAARIAHFAAYFRWMEEAEHEFLRHLGLSVLGHDEEGDISWPRVSVSCEYFAAVKFEDVLDIDVSVARLGDKSVTYTFAVSHAGRLVARMQLTAVCCRMSADGPPTGIRIPDEFARRLAPYVIDKSSS